MMTDTTKNNTPIDAGAITAWTDSYFTNTKDCVVADGDADVTYAVFTRVPTLFAPRIAMDWMQDVEQHNGYTVQCQSPYRAGDIVAAGEPALYISGKLSQLAECETLLLQKWGACGVAALNAYKCASEMPSAPFIAMGARHCTGTQMQEMMDYAASVGGKAAQERHGAKGFVNSASNATAHFFGQSKGAGTMPHALVGFYNSTLIAAQRFRQTHPDKPFIVLNDYFGREITDSIAVARAFPDEAANGTLCFRLDTNGARYLEGLDYDASIEVIRANAPHMLAEHWDEKQLKILYREGVSVAAVWHFKNAMTKAGFPHIGIFASSGFDAEKCRMMQMAKAPLSGIGTGSYIPANFHDTYATADILRYNGQYRIKTGREYLIERHRKDSLRFTDL